MIGLPFEKDEDIIAIHDLIKRILSEARLINKSINITVSVSNFVPKAHTPFQWVSQMTFEEMQHKHKILKELFYKTKGAFLKIHDMEASFLEGVMARADKKIGDLIELAFKKGAKFDAWNDKFNLKIWLEAMEELEINPLMYTGERKLEEELPWDFIDTGINKEFYIRELEKAKVEALSPDCREKCLGCGMNKYINCGG